MARMDLHAEGSAIGAGEGTLHRPPVGFDASSRQAGKNAAAAAQPGSAGPDASARIPGPGGQPWQQGEDFFFPGSTGKGIRGLLGEGEAAPL
jgi:hypothetical protein